MPASQPPAETTAAELRVLDALDEAALVETLVELVRVPSVTGTDAESDLQHTMSRWLEEAGLEVDLWSLDLDGLRADPDFPGTEAPRVEGHGVVGTAPGEGEPALVLQGHVDVVPVGDLANWTGAQPFSAHIANGVLHGRGACDMKAGVAVNLAVARALTFRIEAPAAPPTAAPGRRASRPSRRSGRCTSPCASSRPAATSTRTPCSATTRCPTASRSARCAPATGPARCPTCSSPRAGWACSWTRTPGSPARCSRMPSPWPPLPTP